MLSVKMTLFIQRAKHWDTQALHAKLDELLRAHSDSRTKIAKIDEKEPEEIEDFRASQKRDDDGDRT